MAGFLTDTGKKMLADLGKEAAAGPRLEFDFGPGGITMLTQQMDNFGIAVSMVRLAHDVHGLDFVALVENLDKLFGAFGVWLPPDSWKAVASCMMVYAETAPLVQRDPMS